MAPVTVLYCKASRAVVFPQLQEPHKGCPYKVNERVPSRAVVITVASLTPTQFSRSFRTRVRADRQKSQQRLCGDFFTQEKQEIAAHQPANEKDLLARRSAMGQDEGLHQGICPGHSHVRDERHFPVSVKLMTHA